MTIVAGDDIEIPITLKKNGATFTIDSGATVTAQIISSGNGLTLLSSPVTLDNAATGADWANSLVVLELTSAQSDVLTAGSAKIEIQVEDTVNTAGKTTWFTPVTILADTIP